MAITLASLHDQSEAANFPHNKRWSSLNSSAVIHRHLLAALSSSKVIVHSIIQHRTRDFSPNAGGAVPARKYARWMLTTATGHAILCDGASIAARVRRATGERIPPLVAWHVWQSRRGASIFTTPHTIITSFEAMGILRRAPTAYHVCAPLPDTQGQDRRISEGNFQ